MIDLNTAYNNVVVKRQEAEEKAISDALEREQARKDSIVKLHTVNETYNSIINENFENIKTFLIDDFIVTLESDIYTNERNSDSTVYDFKKIIFKYTGDEYWQTNGFSYATVKNSHSYNYNNTVDELKAIINALLSDKVVDLKLNGIRNIFGGYIKR